MLPPVDADDEPQDAREVQRGLRRHTCRVAPLPKPGRADSRRSRPLVKRCDVRRRAADVKHRRTPTLIGMRDETLHRWFPWCELHSPEPASRAGSRCPHKPPQRPFALRRPLFVHLRSVNHFGAAKIDSSLIPSSWRLSTLCMRNEAYRGSAFTISRVDVTGQWCHLRPSSGTGTWPRGCRRNLERAQVPQP